MKRQGGRPLRVLLVEDSENDALLLLRELGRGGYEPLHERVDTPEEMERALREADARGEAWELVVSDYYMPRFRAPEAIALLRELGYDTPIIVVSGKVGEAAAVEAMRAGAQDYITKDNMTRLNPAVARELAEAEVRRQGRRAEEELGRSEERFRRLVEQAADAMLVHDLDGNFVDVNRQACESLGYSREELLGMSVADIEAGFAPGSLERLWAGLSDGGPLTLEGTHRRKDGSTFPVEVRVGVFESGGRSLILALARDVTGRKEAERRLREAEVRYRTLVEQIPAVTYVQETTGAKRLSYVSPQYEAMLGYSPETEVLDDEQLMRTVHPDDRERLLAEDRRTDETGEPFRVEYRRIAADGRVVWVRDEAVLVRDEEDKPLYWQGVFFDITEQKEVEKALRESEERFRFLAEEVAEGIVLVEDGKILDANPSYAQMYGYDLEELIGMDVLNLSPPDLREKVARRIAEENIEPYEAEGLKKDGTVFPIEIRPRIIPYYGRRVRVTSVLDLTERRRAEEELRISEARFRTIVDQSPLSIQILSPDGRTLRVNRAWEELWGTTAEALGDYNLLEDEQLVEKGIMPYILRGFAGESTEIPAIVYDPEESIPGLSEHRETRWVRAFIYPIEDEAGGIREVILVHEDITERKRAEEELVRLASYPRLNPNPIIETSVAGEVTYMNPAAERDFPELPALGREHPMLAGLEEAEREILDSGEAPLVREIEVGKTYHQQVISRLEGSGLLRIYTTDVTERRQAEEAVRESERRFRSLVQNASDIVVILDEDGTIVYESPAVERVLGIKPEERIGVSAFDVVHPDDRERVVGVFGEFVGMPGVQFPVEYRIHGRDGFWHDFEAIATNLLDDPAVGGVVINARDVTERKRAQEALGQSHALLNAVVEGTTDAVFVKDAQGCYLMTNTANARILGRPAEEILGKTDDELLPPEISRPLQEADRRVMETGETITLEERVPVAGEARTFLSTKAAYRDHRGEVVGVIGVATDITERKRAETELKESEERYRAVVEQAAEGILLVDADSGRILEANAVYQDLLDYTREEILGLTFYDVVPYSREDIDCFIERVRQQVSYVSGERRHRRKDGSLVDVEVGSSAISYGGREVVCIVVHDISERKRAEEELREAEVRYRTLVEQIPAVIYVDSVTEEGATTYVSPQVEDLTGYSPADYLSAPGFWKSLLHPDDRERVLSGYARSFATGEPFGMEYRFVARDGTVVWVRDEATLVRDEGGNLLYWQGVLTDITERRKAEEALRQSEELYRTVVEQAAENIFIVDAESKRILEANDALSRSLGYSPEELKGMTLYDLVAHDRESVDANVARVIGERRRSIGERRYRRKDGSMAEVEVNASAISYGGRPAMCVVAHDVTERNRAERAMREVKEAERARIAREMHDDILQNLVYALQEIQIMQITDGENPALEDTADALRRSVEGLRAAIFEMRLEGTLEASFISSLEALLDLNRRMARGRYELELVVEEGWPENVSEGVGRELVRVIQEALTNARRHADPTRVRVTLGGEDGRVYAEVSDDGRGFDPGSSRVGIGSHSMSQRAREIGGALSVESAPGKGTRVRLEAPLSAVVEERARPGLV